jgi:hypothetical protein
MRNWSPKTRNYWGQKRRRDSIPSDQDESDTASVRSPMPWEPQDTTPDSTNYRQEDNSEYGDYGNTPALKTIVITPEPSSPIWENAKSVIDTLKGKPPEDIDPQNFIQKIVKRMLGADENAHQALNRRAPKILGADISGPMISADSPDGIGGRSDYLNRGNGLTNIPKVLGNVITGPVISSDSPDGQGRGEFLSEVEKIEKQIQKPANHQNKIWPSGYIYPLPDSFKMYKSQDFGGSHMGIDIVGKTSGEILDQPILSVCDGWIDLVVKANQLVDGGGTDVNRGGIRVRVRDSSGLYYIYYHMSPDSNQHLKIGQEVSQGFPLGRVGSSGRGNFDDRKKGTGIHLHFEMWDGIVNNIDYRKYFPELSQIPEQ